MNNQNDIACIEQVLGGDTGAFAVIVERYSHRVFALTERVSGSREDAEELTQDTFLKVFQSLQKFRRDSTFSTWLYRIAYNTAISHTRKGRGIISIELRDEGVKDGSDAFDAGERSHEEQLERLGRAMALLLSDERALLLLFYNEEKPIREIAGIMSLSEENVRVRLHRVRKRLAAATVFYASPAVRLRTPEIGQLSQRQRLAG